MRRFFIALSVLLLALYSSSKASSILSDSTDTKPPINTGPISSFLSTQIFLGYMYYLEPQRGFNEFVVKRGYINFSKDLTSYLSGRITPDITLDREGDGEGDVEMRLKYCYMQFKIPNWVFLYDPSFYVGQVFTPWIEFEEKINRYRVEGAHFLDRVKQTPSADFGVAFTSLLGGLVNENYRRKVNDKYPGKYGSLAMGLYNGGGYHALEKNKNKTFQWRISLRPFTNNLPGFQLSASGAIGKGNIPEMPEWHFNSIFLSYEHEWFTTTTQYFSAIGNASGRMIDETTKKSLPNQGASLFSEIKLFRKKASIIGRFDWFEINETSGSSVSERIIFGMAYHVSGRNKVMLNYNYLNSRAASVPSEKIIELMLELAF